MAKKLKGQTLIYKSPPHIVSWGTIVGPEEGKGPLGNSFDLVCNDAKCGQKSWEKGEKKMVQDVIGLALSKEQISPFDVDFIVGGDLLSQLIIANYVARDFDVPFLGLYGACSTMIEALAVASLLMDGGFADCTLAFSSSHYQTAERQFRTPLEYGAQYAPYKQWTVTGAGAYVLGWLDGKVWITHSTFGKVIDLGITDGTDMGTAMAPAAADTILQHFKDTDRGPQDYDFVITGDLGKVGSDALNTLLLEHHIELGDKLNDCGWIIFGGDKKYGAGGSGCAASGTLLGSYYIPKIIGGEINRILIVGTGALLSPLSIQQKESIPAVGHAIVVEKIP